MCEKGYRKDFGRLHAFAAQWIPHDNYGREKKDGMMPAFQVINGLGKFLY